MATPPTNAITPAERRALMKRHAKAMTIVRFLNHGQRVDLLAAVVAPTNAQLCALGERIGSVIRAIRGIMRT